MTETSYAWLDQVDSRLRILAEEWTTTKARVVEKVRYGGRSTPPVSFHETRCALCMAVLPHDVFLHEVIVDYIKTLGPGPSSSWLCPDPEACMLKRAVRSS